jgi:hypothetical protein
MARLIVSLKCFDGWTSEPADGVHLQSTLDYITPLADGFLIPLSFHELEDLSDGGVSALRSHAVLSVLPHTTVRAIWERPETTICLPPITDLVDGAEPILAGILAEIMESVGVFRFSLPIESVEAAQRLRKLTAHLSPFITLTVWNVGQNARVHDELSALMSNDSQITFAVKARDWMSEDAQIGLMRTTSFCQSHLERYSMLRWSAPSSTHRAYHNRDLPSYLVAGSEHQEPAWPLDALPQDGFIVVEGSTPVNASPLLMREIQRVGELCCSTRDTNIVQAESLETTIRPDRKPLEAGQLEAANGS